MSQLLRNDIIALRALEPTDLDTLYRWENDSRLWYASDTVAPYSRAALWQYLENYTLSENWLTVDVYSWFLY